MAETFELEVATPERLLVREQVSEAQVPAANGYLGILPGHAPLLGELGAGELTYVSERPAPVHGGRRWLGGSAARTRARAGDPRREGRRNRLRARRSGAGRAHERLAHPEAGIDVARALNALKRAQARLAAAAHK